jgi:hypothetical protein
MVALGVLAQLDAMLRIFWTPGYLKRQDPQISSRQIVSPCGLLKTKFNTNKHCTINDFKECIYQETAAIPEAMIQNAFGASRPFLRGRQRRPLSAPFVTGWRFTKTGMYLKYLITPSVNK